MLSTVTKHGYKIHNFTPLALIKLSWRTIRSFPWSNKLTNFQGFHRQVLHELKPNIWNHFTESLDKTARHTWDLAAFYSPCLIDHATSLSQKCRNYRHVIPKGLWPGASLNHVSLTLKQNQKCLWSPQRLIIFQKWKTKWISALSFSEEIESVHYTLYFWLQTRAACCKTANMENTIIQYVSTSWWRLLGLHASSKQDTSWNHSHYYYNSWSHSKTAMSAKLLKVEIPTLRSN